jgi:hypothetical protein
MPNERFLVDTSVWIFALRRDPVLEIKDRIDSLLKEDTVITTGMIKLEILAGTRTEKEYRRLKSHFDALIIEEMITLLTCCGKAPSCPVRGLADCAHSSSSWRTVENVANSTRRKTQGEQQTIRQSINSECVS